MSQKKDLAKNSTLNIIASALPLAVLQIVVLPIVNNKVGDEPYGLIITLIGVLTLFPIVFSGVLNNVRIIRDLEYENEGLLGDFNVLAAILGASSMVLTCVVGLMYIGEPSILDCLSLAVTSFLIFFDGYYYTGFLVKLDYKKILILSLIKSAGYLVGLAAFMQFGYWYFIYIIAFVAGDIYILCNTDLPREPFRKTKRFKRTASESLVLLTSSFLNSVTNYADRLVLFPLCGATSVSVYYVSTLLGKLTSQVIGPISSVLLAVVGRKQQMKSGDLKLLLAASTIASVIIYAICLLISRPVLEFLYPSLVDESMKLIAVTYASSLVYSIISVINPIVLRFCNIAWQIVLSVISVVSFFALGLLFLSFWGLFGFSVGVLCSMVLSLAVRLIIIVVKRSQIVGADSQE